MDATNPPIAVLRFELTCEREGRLPPFKGSALRGALGRALRRITCLHRNRCGSRCQRPELCLYGQTFEPSAHTHNRFADAPRPYVLRSRSSQIAFKPGDRLEFELVLIGPVVRDFVYFLLAVDTAAKSGLGAARIPFSLTRVTDAAGTVLFAGGRVRATPCLIPRAALLELAERVGDAQVAIRFGTPTRIQNQHQLEDTPSFGALVRSGVRRLYALRSFYGDPNESLGFPDVSQADAVVIREVRGRWQPLLRFSSRQQRTMSLGGFTGTIVYAGPVQDWRELLAWLAYVHVGKGATFGLGEVQPLPEA